MIDYPDSIEAHSAKWAGLTLIAGDVVDVAVDDPVRVRAPGRAEAVVRRADYVIKRGFFALVTIFVAITLNFFLFRVLPGSAVTDLAEVPPAPGPRSSTR